MPIPENVPVRVSAAGLVFVACLAGGCATTASGPTRGEFERGSARDGVVLADAASLLGRPGLERGDDGAAKAAGMSGPSFPILDDSSGSEAGARSAAGSDPSASALLGGREKTSVLMRGDVVDVVIADGGASTDLGVIGAPLRLERIEVDASGKIPVPGLGLVHVAGLSPADAGVAVERMLVRRMLSPSVVISLRDRMVASYTISGNVTSPGRQSIPLAGRTLAEAVAMSGPLDADLSGGILLLRRGGVGHEIPLRHLALAGHLQILPGDDLEVLKGNEHVTVLGAAGSPVRVPVRRQGLTLAEALAEARGLAPREAGGRKLFLVRPAMLSESSVPLNRSDGKVASPASVYAIDLASPVHLATMASVRLRDGDIIVVPSSPFVRFRDIMQIALNASALGQLATGL